MTQKRRRPASVAAPTDRFDSTFLSGRRDLNPRRSPWQGDTLPLSYARRGDLVYAETSFRSRGWVLLSFLSSCISECPKGYAAHYTAHGALCPSSSLLYPAIEIIFATFVARQITTSTGLFGKVWVSDILATRCSVSPVSRKSLFANCPPAQLRPSGWVPEDAAVKLAMSRRLGWERQHDSGRPD